MLTRLVLAVMRAAHWKSEMFSGAPPAQLSPAATTAAPLLLLQLAGTAGAARSGSDLHVVNIQMIVWVF